MALAPWADPARAGEVEALARRVEALEQANLALRQDVAELRAHHGARRRRMWPVWPPRRRTWPPGSPRGPSREVGHPACDCITAHLGPPGTARTTSTHDVLRSPTCLRFASRSAAP